MDNTNVYHECGSNPQPLAQPQAKAMVIVNQSVLSTHRQVK